MRTQPPSYGDESDYDPVTRLVLDFEVAWRDFEAARRAGPPSIEQFRSRAPEGIRAAALPELVKVDLQARQRLGQRPTARDYLDCFPSLAVADGPALSLIYEEFCLRAEAGEGVTASEFCARYPTWGDSLAAQLAIHRDLSRADEPPRTAPDFPEPPARFGEFDLNATLGQGGSARVYRATDSQLGGKTVALKVSLNRGLEEKFLGAMDHPNIVPVHSIVVDPATGLRGLSMPYRPGPPLDRVIRRLGALGGRLPRSARWLLREGAEPARGPGSGAGAVEPKGVDDRPGWAGFPARGSHADAVAWLGLRMASALAHAHGLGFLHRDVKPENVLLTGRDGPQLIDFNLAAEPLRADEAAAAQRGGTLPYAAREHLDAFLDPGRWQGVGAAADLFSLGLILRELLTGQLSWRPPGGLSVPRSINALALHRAAPPAPIRATNRAVPHALSAIVDRCTAEAPADRYPNAEALADDLSRFLARRPLRGARNPSRLEPALNLARRNRGLLATAAALAIVAAGLAATRPGRVTPTPPTHAAAPPAPVPLEDLLATPATLALVDQLAAAGDLNAIDRTTELIRRKPDALPALRVGTEKHRSSLTILVAYGDALLQAGKIDKAALQYERALRLNRTHPPAVWGLVEVDEARGLIGEAHIRVEEAIAIREGQGPGADDPVLHKLRAALVKVGVRAADAANRVSDHSGALRHLDRARAAVDRDTRPGEAPDYVYIHLIHSASIANDRIVPLWRLGRPEESRAHYLQAVKDLNEALKLKDKDHVLIEGIRDACDKSLQEAQDPPPSARD